MAVKRAFPHRKDKKFDLIAANRDGRRPKSGAYAICTPACVWRERRTYRSFLWADTRLQACLRAGQDRVIAKWYKGLWLKVDDKGEITC